MNSELLLSDRVLVRKINRVDCHIWSTYLEHAGGTVRLFETAQTRAFQPVKQRVLIAIVRLFFQQRNNLFDRLQARGIILSLVQRSSANKQLLKLGELAALQEVLSTAQCVLVNRMSSFRPDEQRNVPCITLSKDWLSRTHALICA